MLILWSSLQEETPKEEDDEEKIEEVKEEDETKEKKKKKVCCRIMDVYCKIVLVLHVIIWAGIGLEVVS